MLLLIFSYYTKFKKIILNLFYLIYYCKFVMNNKKPYQNDSRKIDRNA